MAYFTTSGGLCEVTTMRLIAEVAAEHALGTLRLTPDQGIVVPGLSETQRLRLQQRLDGDLRDTAPTATRITTSAPVAGVGEGRSWLRPSTFTDLLSPLRALALPLPDLFLGDAMQPYLPLPPTRLVALARAKEEQWDLGVRRADGTLHTLPGTLRGALLPEALRRIAPLVQAAATPDEALLVERLDDLLRSATPAPAPTVQRLYTPPGALCLAQPEHGWNARFLQDLCLFAINHGVGTLGLSPTRSLLIHGLNERARASFDELCLLSRFAENPNPWKRHLLIETDHETSADTLAALLFQKCPVNPGFSIALQNETATATAGVHFTLSPVPQRGLWKRPRRQKYRVAQRAEGDALFGLPRHTSDGLSLQDAADFILARIEESLRGAPAASAAQERAPSETPARANSMRRCKECKTVYDEAYGDPFGGVPAGTSFTALPSQWGCPVCGAAASAYAIAPAEGLDNVIAA